MKIPQKSSVCLAALAAFLLLANFLVMAGGLFWQAFTIVRVTYNFNTLAAPVILLAAAALGVVVRRKYGLDSSWLRASAICFSIAVLLVGVRIYATHIEPYRLMLHEVRFHSSKVEHPLRILHISDIQSGGIGRYEEGAFRRMKDLRPDIIIFTGDLLQPLKPRTFESEVPKIAALFRGLQPPLGIYGVHGDSDGLVRRLPVSALGGLRMIRNQEVSIPWGGTRISLFGLTRRASHDPEEAASLIRKWLDRVGPTDLTLLLGHSPDFAAAARNFAIDLCLAGHTHGGQIRLPWIGPLVTSTRYIPRSWTLGYREIGKTRLNVSGGIGCEHARGLPCIRVYCPPEMTLIVVEPAAPARP
jgi:predicted MPP superfamily phosphohydrolase